MECIYGCGRGREKQSTAATHQTVVWGASTKGGDEVAPGGDTASLSFVLSPCVLHRGDRMCAGGLSNQNRSNRKAKQARRWPSEKQELDRGGWVYGAEQAHREREREDTLIRLKAEQTFSQHPSSGENEKEERLASCHPERRRIAAPPCLRRRGGGKRGKREQVERTSPTFPHPQASHSVRWKAVHGRQGAPDYVSVCVSMYTATASGGFSMYGCPGAEVNTPASARKRQAKKKQQREGRTLTSRGGGLRSPALRRKKHAHP